MQPLGAVAPVVPVEESVPDAPYKRQLVTQSGHAFWLVSDRPFAEAATDMFRDAIRAFNAPPSLLSRAALPKQRRPTEVV